MIKIEKEEYKKTSTVIDCEMLPKCPIVITIPTKGKFSRFVNKVKNKGKKTKQVMEEIEL